MKIPTPDDPRRRRIALAGLLIITALLGLRGIGNESSVMLGGDMARYVMNGVFVHDLIADGGVTNYETLTRYAERYYAKYPALSLGHHPPVPYLSVVPFFWLFGISVLAIRLAALGWFLAGAWGVYAVTNRLFNWQAAMWAAVLFITNLIVLRSGQYLLSEMPMAALVLWSVHALLRFCDSRRVSHFLWFIALVVASLYAKQLAVLLFPVYVAIVIWKFGWRHLLTRRALGAAAIVVVLSIPIAIMTVGLSPRSFGMALTNAMRLFSGRQTAAVNRIVGTIISAHLSIPALAVTIASVVLLIVRRRPEVLIGLIWIVTVVLGSVVFAGTTEPARYAFGAIPAYSILIAALITEAHSRKTKILAVVLLSATLWWQVWTIRDVHPSGAGGYEETAEFVLSRNREPAVLYDSQIDTGYFMFFMRKHDPARSGIILRSDKIFWAGAWDREITPEAMHDLLKRLGIRWIVLEDRAEGPNRRPLFRAELKGPRFVERKRVPVITTAVPGLSLVVYEYLDAVPADLDTEIRINLPIGERDFVIRFRDLVGRNRQ
jgi:hypothetical protein